MTELFRAIFVFICLYDLKVLSDKVMSGQSADQVSLFLKAVNHYLKHILLPVTLLESAEEKEWSYGFFSQKNVPGVVVDGVSSYNNLL